MPDISKRRPYKEVDFLLRIVEYPYVVDHTLNKQRLLKANQIDIFSREKALYLLLHICDSEGINCPRLKIVRHRSGYYRKKRLIKIQVYKVGSKNAISLGTLIHELAHHVHCQSQIKRNCYKEKHHGKMFTVIQDYLLHEYEDIWKNLQ